MKRVHIFGIVAVLLVAGIAVSIYEFGDTNLANYASGGVTGISWNGEYWLISGHDDDNYLLAVYDGVSFEKIQGPWDSSNYDYDTSEISFSIENMASTPEEFYSYPAFDDWVLGSFDGYWLLSSTEWITVFDEEEFVTTSLYTPLTTMACGGTYCLMLGLSYTGQAAYPILVRYDEAELSNEMFTVLEDQMAQEGVATRPLSMASCGNENWYISAYGYIQDDDGSIEGSIRELLTYDGATFKKVADLPKGFYARSMGYNDEYLLLTDSQILFKYEDGGFTDVTSGIDVEWALSTWGNDIVWADGYWMVNMGGHLFTYDGYTFTALMSGVEGIVWNGKYWLIDSDSGLLRYDGETFTDLTCAFLDAGTALGRPAWHYLVPALTVLAVAALAFVRGRR